MGETAVAENLDFAGMRKAMVDSQLRPNDIMNPRVLGAMATTPREDFVPPRLRPIAYIDRAIALGGGLALNPPLATGLMLDRAAPQPSDRALVIGSTTGYLPALLSQMVEHVVVLSEDAALSEAIASQLAGRANVETVSGPLAKGWKKHAPYTLIVIDGAVEVLPEALPRQLADGGRLVTGLVEEGITRLAVGRIHAGHFGLVHVVDTDITQLPQFAAPREYVF